jgi:hypothetical protein
MWHVQSYKDRNICVLLDSQAALNNLQINSRLVWDCHQSLVEWAEHKWFNWCRCQYTWEVTDMK